jgi:lipopolysaccharide assembly outer membrane protein LptD (OstA)
VSFTLNTKFDIPLQTTLGYTSNVNRFPAGVIGKTTELNYATLLLAGTYIVAEGRGTFSAALSPTLGDFRRFALDLSGQWSLTPLMSVLLQYSLFVNQGARNDDFWSLKYRYEL